LAHMLRLSALVNENRVIFQRGSSLAQGVHPLIITSESKAKAFPHRRFFIWHTAPPGSLKLQNLPVIHRQRLGGREGFSHNAFMIGRHSPHRGGGFRLVAL
jgi:hypothetical protein